MLDSTFELISQAASNPHMVFCFCNLIIAILLVGTSKPSSGFSYGGSTPGAGPAGAGEESAISEKSGEGVENEERRAPHEGDVDDHDDDDDDELKRRVEEFIEKTNRGWRAEKVERNLFGAME